MRASFIAGLLTALSLVALGCSGGDKPDPASPGASGTPTGEDTVSAGTPEGRSGPSTPVTRSSPSPATPPPGMPPAWPFVFTGAALAQGEPVPPGYQVIGRIDDYESEPVNIEATSGRFLGLTVGPLKEKWFDRPITFHLVAPNGSEVQASQSVEFVPRPRPTVFNNYRLSFPSLP